MCKDDGPLLWVHPEAPIPFKGGYYLVSQGGFTLISPGAVFSKAPAFLAAEKDYRGLDVPVIADAAFASGDEVVAMGPLLRRKMPGEKVRSGFVFGTIAKGARAYEGPRGCWRDHPPRPPRKVP